MPVQSVLFDKRKWSLKDSKKYLRAHGFKHFAVDETSNYYRFRQIDPTGPKALHFHYFTKEAGPGIRYVMGF